MLPIASVLASMLKCNMPKRMIPYGLTWQEYQAWRTKAMQARDAYVAGKLSAEEVIKIINNTDIN